MSATASPTVAAGAGEDPPDARTLVHVEHVMGTAVSFRALHPETQEPVAMRVAIADACSLLHRIDAMFSTWKADSPMSRYRRGELRRSELPPEIPALLERCEEARALSRGWFDPWAMPGGVDPTGLVKGWAVERALDVLRAAGATAAIVNGGGDVAVCGRPPGLSSWRVGVRHPWRSDALAGVVGLEAALATSGGYERAGGLIDPRTGEPGIRAASASVCGPSLAMADALATALAVGGDDAFDAIDRIDAYDAYLVRPDGSEVWSAGMPFVD